MMDSSSSKLDSLPSHLVELILSCLPIPSIVRAASVCKSWNSIIRSRSFKSRVFGSDPLPCLFISGNFYSQVPNPIFALTPKSDEWFKIGNSPLFQASLTASNGFFFVTGIGKFWFRKVFSGAYHQTALPRYSECNTLIGTFDDPNFRELTRFIVVGGNRHVDDQYREVCLAVDIYSPHLDSWERCTPLPEIFRDTISTSSQLLSSAVFQGKFHVFDNDSCLISLFDLEKRSWSSVQTIRPPGVLFSYLISCRDQLVLAGVCGEINDDERFVFKLWRIDEKTFEFKVIGVMPEELHSCFFHSKDQPSIFRWKCVGSGNVVYVFSVEREENFQACVCEIIGTTISDCRWTRIPNLPDCVSRDYDSYEIVSCNVSIQDILGKELSE